MYHSITESQEKVFIESWAEEKNCYFNYQVDPVIGLNCRSHRMEPGQSKTLSQELIRWSGLDNWICWLKILGITVLMHLDVIRHGIIAAR